jgi:hypothetical protein
VLAQVAWTWLAAQRPAADISGDIWHLFLVSLMIVMVLAVGSALLGYLSWNRQSSTEASMYLQDTIWSEISREQRSMGIWLAWRHARRRQRGEKS